MDNNRDDGGSYQTETELEKALIQCVNVFYGRKSAECAIKSLLEIIGGFYGAENASIAEYDFKREKLNYKFGASGNSFTEKWIKENGKDRYFGKLFTDAKKIAGRITVLSGGELCVAVPFIKNENDVCFLSLENIVWHADEWRMLYCAIVLINEEMERNRLISQLEYTSYTDLLTGVKNRNYFNLVISKYQNNPCDSFAVVFLDLDGLKEINDTYGHSIGDRNIIAVAKMLKIVFKGRDIFRTGGDEFVVFLEECGYDDVREKVEYLYNRLKKMTIICSYGICCQKDNANILEIIESAENEMYVFKRKHHEKIVSVKRRETYSDIVRRDIACGRFFAMIQPKINLRSGNLEGAEILIRGKKLTGENEMPGEFIPVMEKNNCIDLIDYFMLEEACKIQTLISKKYSSVLPISVNISRSTLFVNTLCSDLIQICEKYGVQHHAIVLEVTESMNLSSEGIIAKCEELKKAGFSLEIDDFGKHFTDIGFLCSDIFSMIKIDRSIVNKLSDYSITEELVAFLIAKCRKCNVRVLAEGVETEKELTKVRNMGFDAAQGFYFAKPMKVDAFISEYMGSFVSI